jgi:hypothetical protein
MTKRERSVLFKVVLYAMPGTDGVRALRAALKTLLRRFGLRAVSVEEIHEDTRPGASKP